MSLTEERYGDERTDHSLGLIFSTKKVKKKKTEIKKIKIKKETKYKRSRFYGGFLAP